MSELFYKRYSQKSDADLLRIINNPKSYQEKAVECAKKVLNERNGVDEKYSINGKKLFERVIEKELNVYSDIIDAQNQKLTLGEGWKEYKKSFSIKELFSSASLALVYIVGAMIINNLDGDSWWFRNDLLIKMGLFLALMTSNHIFYMRENGVRNRFVGRVIQSVLMAFFVDMFSSLFDTVFYSIEFSLSFESWVSCSILILMGEGFLTFLNRVIVRRQSWEIW